MCLQKSYRNYILHYINIIRPDQPVSPNEVSLMLILKNYGSSTCMTIGLQHHLFLHNHRVVSYVQEEKKNLACVFHHTTCKQLERGITSQALQSMSCWGSASLPLCWPQAGCLSLLCHSPADPTNLPFSFSPGTELSLFSY